MNRRKNDLMERIRHEGIKGVRYQDSNDLVKGKTRKKKYRE